MIPVSHTSVMVGAEEIFTHYRKQSASEERNAKVIKRAHLKLKAIFNQILCQIDQGEYEDPGNAADIS